MSSGTAKGCFRIQQYVISLVHYTQDDSSFNQYLLRESIKRNSKISQSLRTLICSRIKNSKHWKFILLRIPSRCSRILYIENCSRIVLNCFGEEAALKKQKRSLSDSWGANKSWTLELYWSKDEALAKSKV